MSFTGSLVLSGIGGLVYKYGGQQSERETEVPVGFQSLTIGFFQARIRVFRTRLETLSRTFWRQLVETSGYKYPIRGVSEMFRSGAYFFPWARAFAFYLVLYLTIAFIYFCTILPVYLALLAFLGPIGFAIAYLHFLLHSNMLTMMVMRFTQLHNSLFDLALVHNGKEIFVKTAIQSPTLPKRYYVPLNTYYFWLNYLPWRIFIFGFGFTVLIVLLLISFIPIIGPFIFNALISPFIARIYFSRFLRLKKLDNKQRNDEFYFNFGTYVSFGFVAGQLEILPFVSGLIYSSNSVGGGLFAIKALDSEHAAAPSGATAAATAAVSGSQARQDTTVA
ncbi:LANO_0C02476g1_1 [Lachancea nothofagi CBS 11611]|uniref:LANO_0C02476g1_1 n=1 Tax=Lachancea nothofagi CBS 11611 TaxID=1266666 RepID=A0A1G4J4T8_9SACH|nr:LANO_0C02476g1_1 [Lachancea nothofagi CBS 11611]